MRELNLPMTGVEVGVAEGYFSNDLLDQGFEKLYMVDVWKSYPNVLGDIASSQQWHDRNYKAATERVAKHGAKAVILRGLSEAMSVQVPDNSLGLVYLDGDHSYEGVVLDINVWVRKLVNGGILASHDYDHREYGVKKAMDEYAKENGFHLHHIPENKPEDAGAWFRVWHSK